MIGTGVVGASVTQELARRGLTVMAVDRAPGVGGGCSYANAALLAPSHVTPLATPALLRETPLHMVRRPPAVKIRADLTLTPWLGRLAASARRADVMGARLRGLAQDSVQLHRQLADDGLSPTLRKTGALDVYRRRPRHRPENFLQAERINEREPSLTGVVGGTYAAEEWTLESRSFTSSLLADAQAAGAVHSFGSEVELLPARAGRVVGVQVDGREILADHVVLAAGLQSTRLAAQVGVDIPLRGGRGYVIDLAATPMGPAIPVRLKEHRVVITPLADRIRVCGAMDFGNERRPVDPRRGEALLKIATDFLPILADQPVIDRWAGERPCTSDGMPIIGASQLAPQLTVAAGHGMWGMILAPISGKIVANAIIDGAPTEGWLSPDRFTR